MPQNCGESSSVLRILYIVAAVRGVTSRSLEFNSFGLNRVGMDPNRVGTYQLHVGIPPAGVKILLQIRNITSGAVKFMPDL